MRLGESRIIPCTKRLASLLDSWKGEQRGRYDKANENRAKRAKGSSVPVVTEWSENTPIVGNRYGQHIMQRTFTKWWDSERTSYEYIPEDFGMHSFRHSFATYLSVDLKLDAETVRMLLGWKTQHMANTYEHSDFVHMSDAVSALDNAMPLTEPEQKGPVSCGNCPFWTESPMSYEYGACWAECDGNVKVMAAKDTCGQDIAVLKLAS